MAATARVLYLRYEAHGSAADFRNIEATLVCVVVVMSFALARNADAMKAKRERLEGRASFTYIRIEIRERCYGSKTLGRL